VAIAVATLTALPVLGWLGALSWREVAAFEGAGLLVALVGFADDHASVAACWRLLGHFVAAAWMLALLGGLPPLPVFGRTVDPGLVGQALAVLYIVWLINLTNFMDGIDGIAAIEAITVCLAGDCLYFAASTSAPWPAAAMLAAATLGFLLWNWPPAKIFMGDAGSGFLGVMLAGLSLQAAWTAPELFWSWVILLGVFVVDATVTLLWRLARGERVYEAHRSHAYQHAATRRGGHKPITLTVAAINVCWLFPLAWLVAVGLLDGLTGVLVAYAPLAAAAARLDAGRAETA
jgi:Fuc2NAc and GlcNAc transferase